MTSQTCPVLWCDRPHNVTSDGAYVHSTDLGPLHTLWPDAVGGTAVQVTLEALQDGEVLSEPVVWFRRNALESFAISLDQFAALAATGEVVRELTEPRAAFAGTP